MKIIESIKIKIDNQELRLLSQGLNKVVLEYVALSNSRLEAENYISTAMDMLKKLDPVGHGALCDSIDVLFDSKEKGLTVVDEVKADGSKTYKHIPYSELHHGMLIDKLANGFNIRVENIEVIKKLNIEFFTISKLSQVEAINHDGISFSRPTLTEMGIYTIPVIEGGENFPL